MKPLISYYGGKQRIASRIVEQIQRIDHKIYAEPFCGGCAVLYAKPEPRPSNWDDYREAINDTDELVVNLYRVAREQPEALHDLIELTPYSRVEYVRAVDICKGHVDAGSLEKAWALYVNAQMSFGNSMNTGWGASKTTRSHAASWESKRQRLKAALSRLSRVHIDCQDALTFIDQWDHPDTLFYCDPPYINTECGHYGDYTLDDYQALCDKLDNIQGSYILSNYPQAIAPASAQSLIEIATTCSASGKGKTRLSTTKPKAGENKRTECLWICDHTARKTLEPSLAQSVQELAPSPPALLQLTLAV
jgi:DNA adenine methylase